MAARFVSLFLVVCTVPLFCQQGAVVTQSQKWIWSRGQMMRADSPPELDPRAARLAAIHQDTNDLSALSVALQSDLQQLQKGLLSKDLTQNLKKVEKLSKKLRQEVGE